MTSLQQKINNALSLNRITVLHTVHPQGNFVQLPACSGNMTGHCRILSFPGVAEGRLEDCLQECQEETMVSFQYSPLRQMAN